MGLGFGEFLAHLAQAVNESIGNRHSLAHHQLIQSSQAQTQSEGFTKSIQVVRTISQPANHSVTCWDMR
jgi:hypothetical protein